MAFENLVKRSLDVAVKAGTFRSRNVSSGTEEKTFFSITENSGEYFTAGFGKAVILPDDIESRKYYIAGYSENNPARGVLDPQYAHAFLLDDNSGNGPVLLISVDAVGLLISDTEKIKANIKHITDNLRCRYVSVFCTHDHAGIDTMGIWGKLPLSGKDPKFMKLLNEAVRRAVMNASENRKSGKLYLGRARVPDMQEDIRLPVVYSDILTRLRFAPDDKSGDIYFLNFASHSESLQGCNHLVSADFPCYLREKIRNEAGAETVYSVGAIGGMISIKIEDEKTLRREYRLVESTRNIGYKLADYALSITDESELQPKISFAERNFYCPVDNPVLSIAGLVKILDAKVYKYNGRPALRTKVSLLKIDFLNILMLPCELFPELAYGGYLSSEESAEGKSPDINPEALTDIFSDKNLIIIGLADDELGYVIPPNDFMLNADSPYLEKAIDRHGRRHYEETNSMGPQTASVIAENVKKLIF